MKTKLDKEELELSKSYERGEWQSVRNLKKEIKGAKEITEYTFKKDKRMNIRLSERDLVKVQRKAMKEGMPYQTLISNLIHKFVEGTMIERKSSSY